MKYVAIVEPTDTGFAAYLPDLPGCVTTGGTMDEIRRNLHEAANGHVAVMQEYAIPIPEPHIIAVEVDVRSETTQRRSALTATNCPKSDRAVIGALT